MDCATEVHVTRNDGYINGSDRSLNNGTCVCTRDSLRCLSLISAGRLVPSGSVGCGSVLEIPLASGGRLPQALTILGGVRIIDWRLIRPEKGNTDGARGIFETAGCVWALARRPDPPKKRPCATLVHWWGVWQISARAMHSNWAGLGWAEPRHTSVGRVGRYTDLHGCVLARLTVGRSSPWLASSNVRGPSPWL